MSKQLLLIVATLLLVTIALADPPVIPEYSAYRYADGAKSKFPVWWAMNHVYEPVFSCPKEVLQTYLHPNYTLTPSPLGEDQGLVMFITVYYPEMFSEYPDWKTPFNPYWEASVAIMVESPDQQQYPCASTVTDYCPMLYTYEGYRSNSFYEYSSTGKPPAEYLYTQVTLLDPDISEPGEFHMTYNNDDPFKPNITIYGYYGHFGQIKRKVFEMAFDYTGFQPDPGQPYTGSFYEFGNYPWWQNHFWGFWTSEQYTYYWGSSASDTYYVSRHSQFAPYANCTPLFVVLQKRDSPNYVWLHKRVSEQPHQPTCGGACVIDEQCPSTCAHCTNNVCSV